MKLSVLLFIPEMCLFLSKQINTKHLSYSEVQSPERSQGLYVSIHLPLVAVGREHTVNSLYSSARRAGGNRFDGACLKRSVSDLFFSSSLNAHGNSLNQCICRMCPQTISSHDSDQMTAREQGLSGKELVIPKLSSCKNHLETVSLEGLAKTLIPTALIS